MSALDPWSGTFKSSASPLLVTGTIYTELDPNEQAEYNTIITLKYTGIFKNSQEIKGSLQVNPENMKFNIGDQIITFKMTERSLDQIVGKYESQNPKDIGVFQLKINNQKPDDSHCQIM